MPQAKPKTDRVLKPADIGIRPGEWTRPKRIESRASGRTHEAYFQRLTDAQLLDSLTDDQLDAALAIRDGWRVVTEGLGYRPNRFERVDLGQGGMSDTAARQFTDYLCWQVFCDRKKIDHRIAVHVVCEGESLFRLSGGSGALRHHITAHLRNALTAWLDRHGRPLPRVTWDGKSYIGYVPAKPVRIKLPKWPKST